MDEDIDIEEHDILDNPQLKNILPNIDIKEEPLDYDDNYEEYTNEYCGDVEEMDVDSYLGDDDSPEDSQSMESDPKLSPERLKYLQVVLEDWGPRLERSACFCDECETLFATRNALDAHNMTAHSFLVAMDSVKEDSPKKLSPSFSNKYCNHCNKYFDDSDQLIQHLYELITAKKSMKTRAASITIGTKTPEQISKPIPQKLWYQCSVCSVYSDMKYNIRRHYNKFHKRDIMPTAFFPYEPKCRFCKKVYPDPKSYNIHIKLEHRDLHFMVSDPTSNETTIRFECPHCDKNFETKFRCKVHMSRVHKPMKNLIPNIKAIHVPIAKKVTDGLTKVNGSVKPKESRNATLKSNLKLANKNGSYKYKYYQCRKCMCCRIIHPSRPHKCLPERSKRNCAKCHYVFSSVGLPQHYQRHLRLKNLTRANILIVPYNPIPLTTGSGSHNQGANKSKDNIYKCSCGVRFSTKESIRHCTNCSVDPNIRVFKAPVVSNRTENLRKSNSKTKKLQHVAVKTGVKINLAKLKGGKKLTYYQCQKCTCCIERVRHNPHLCTPQRNRKTCSKCHYVFNTKALYNHYKKHLKIKNLTRDSIIIVPYNFPSKEVDTNNQCPSKANGNIYKCSCGIHFPTRESIIKHCTNCSPDQKISCKKCVKCGLKFPTNLLVNHTINHHSNENMKFVVHDVPKLFKCVKCKCLFLKLRSFLNHIRTCDGAIEGQKCLYCKLLFHKTMIADHMDSHLPVQSKQSTKSNSNKIPLYKCGACKVFFVDKKAASIHSVTKHSHKNSNVGCKVCGLRFLKREITTHMDLHHKKRKCTIEDFYVVSVLDLPQSKHEDTVKETKKLVDVDKTPIKQAKLKVYGRMQNASKNKVNDITQSNDVPSDTPKSEGKDKLVKPRLYERLQNDGKARISDSINSGNDLEIIDIENGQLFMCKRCDIHFCNKSTFEKHAYLNHYLKKVPTACTDCDRKFTKISYCIHKKMNICNRGHLKREDNVASTSVKEQCVPEPQAIAVKSPKVIEQDTTPPLLHSSYDFKLYKCEQCNVYFMTQSNCYKHTLNHIPMGPVEYIACKLCNLQFRVSSLNYHMKKHHSGKEVEKVLVEKYSCNGLSDVKVDLYVHTIDKVQTNLVSTTTDDNDETPATVNEANDIKTAPESTEPAVRTAASKDSVPSVMDAESMLNVTVESSNREQQNLDDSVEIISEEYNCSFCDETFNTKTSKKIHESLEHIDGFKDCKICGVNLNASILHELHLGKKNDTFTCCVCNETLSRELLLEHTQKHKKSDS